ncbi:PRD domain-containing protein [Lacticaseibacillus sp. 53-4]|uniref:PRD domain-containing protein n=1 Tax=Lacticaseibacillus sp. 53-4 TaxID=2799575 RepID=UPI0019448322|nr:PRD domain-containing protein [Lacticaseibacillus sp. 53-4]
MKAIKKINNNVAVCLDNENHELIAIGRGLGFPEMPYEITDLSSIRRTFYNVDSMYVGLAKEIPEDIIDASAEVVDMIRMNVNVPISSNLVFTLADHIHFAIQRRKTGMVIAAPMRYDIENLYSDEYELGEKALAIFNKRLKAHLPTEEASNLALHIINAKNMSEAPLKNEENSDLISEITDIIAGFFSLYIDKHDFNYSRFVTHMQYLLKRETQGKSLNTDNQQMYADARKNYPKVAECVDQIAEYLQQQRGFTLEDEEKLYLMMHVNRLCAKEGL